MLELSGKIWTAYLETVKLKPSMWYYIPIVFFAKRLSVAWVYTVDMGSSPLTSRFKIQNCEIRHILYIIFNFKKSIFKKKSDITFISFLCDSNHFHKKIIDFHQRKKISVLWTSKTLSVSAPYHHVSMLTSQKKCPNVIVEKQSIKMGFIVYFSSMALMGYKLTIR